MKVEIITILDRSGSMEKLRSDTIGGYNTFLSGQKALPGQARVTLVQFSDAVDTLYEGVNIQHIGALTQANYIPLGGTALLDAIGITLAKQGARIRNEGWADKVIVSIITDGDENVSTEFTLDQIKDLVHEYETGKGWTFLFQGADIDSFNVGKGLGISGATTRNFAKTSAGMAEAYATMSTFATTARSSL